jgi:hypothetical protein
MAAPVMASLPITVPPKEPEAPLPPCGASPYMELHLAMGVLSSEDRPTPQDPSPAAGPEIRVSVRSPGYPCPGASSFLASANQEQDTKKRGRILSIPPSPLRLFWCCTGAPLLGTHFVVAPEINGLRSIARFVFFLICFYLGFVRK